MRVSDRFCCSLFVELSILPWGTAQKSTKLLHKICNSLAWVCDKKCNIPGILQVDAPLSLIVLVIFCHLLSFYKYFTSIILPAIFRCWHFSEISYPILFLIPEWLCFCTTLSDWAYSQYLLDHLLIFSPISSFVTLSSRTGFLNLAQVLHDPHQGIGMLHSLIPFKMIPEHRYVFFPISSVCHRGIHGGFLGETAADFWCIDHAFSHTKYMFTSNSFRYLFLL